MASNGVHIVYLPVNQAYMVMWFGSRLAGPMPKADAEAYVEDLTR